MMRKYIMVIIMSLAWLWVGAQNEEDAKKYAATITKNDMYDKLSILASDALEGRETGERGQKMAAAFIKDEFVKLGLTAPVLAGSTKSYYQLVPLYTSMPGEAYLQIGSKKYKNFDEIVHYGSKSTSEEKITEVVFAGKGTEEDFKGLNVKGKAVLIIIDNPRANREPAKIAQKKGAQVLLVQGSATTKEFNGFAKNMKHFLSKGSLSLKNPAEGDAISVFFIAPSVTPSILNVKPEKMDEILAKKKKLKPAKITYRIEQQSKVVESENVLGYLEGSDLKDELVVLTAHYDHVGVDGKDVYNGADDDGSGTSAVLELAEAFVKAKADGKGPRRSILFMTVTGEEKGLLGSAYYADNPIFPLENTVVDLNIDMIGRVDKKHKDNPNYVYLVGADRLSSELHEISEKVNETFTQFDLDYTYNDESHPDRIYYRSDHWNFAKNNVPIIFYFNGVHEDYHKPSDTIDKIEFDLLTKRTQLVFYTAWVLANRNQRLVVDKLKDQKVGNN